MLPVLKFTTEGDHDAFVVRIDAPEELGTAADVLFASYTRGAETMIEVMRESHGDVLGLRATGKLTVADYNDVMAPEVRTLLDRFKKLKVLFLIDEPFGGWSLRAAWVNTIFDVKHRRDFDKVAIVGAPRWEQWCVNVAAALVMSGELRTYDRERLDAAWQWVRA